MPAGYVEVNESAKEALCREVKEEIGITIFPEDLKLVYVSHRGTERDNIDLFMICDKWEEEIENREPHKCSELRFFLLEAFTENTIGYIRKVVVDVLNQEIYSEKGWGSPKRSGHHFVIPSILLLRNSSDLSIVKDHKQSNNRKKIKSNHKNSNSLKGSSVNISRQLEAESCEYKVCSPEGSGYTSFCFWHKVEIDGVEEGAWNNARILLAP